MASKTPYIILTALAVAFLLAAAFFLFFFKIPSECNFGCASAPSFMNGPQCLSVVEKYSDPSIPTPSQNLQPYLSEFIYAEGEGAPFCAPVWYAFRYVRNSDGGYSTMGPWSGAVYSGSENLPWYPGFSPSGTPAAPSGTSFSAPSGTCNANQPTVILTSPINSPGGQFDSLSGYSLNVHRQIGSIDANGNVTGFDPSSEGDVVGVFEVFPGLNGATATFVDAVFNPSPNSTATRCC